VLSRSFAFNIAADTAVSNHVLSCRANQGAHGSHGTVGFRGNYGGGVAHITPDRSGAGAAKGGGRLGGHRG